MRRWLTMLIFLTGMACASAQIRGTEVNQESGSITPHETYAVIIGISKYKNLPSLQYADRDAQSFYDFMVSDEGMNIDSSHVILRLNEEANINNIGGDLTDIVLRDIKTGDRVFFFFAGHGDYDARILQDQALLLLYGAPRSNYLVNAFNGDHLSTSDLHLKFTRELIKKGAEVMLIIDACHSGGVNMQLSGGENGGIITSNALNLIQSTVKIYSCRASQYSLESEQYGKGRGLFSYVLMEALYGMANSDNDSVITMMEVQRYLEDNVPKLALPNKQNPVIKFDDNSMPVCRVNQKLLAEYKKAKTKDLPFLIAANIKGDEATWLASMDSSARRLYQLCKLQIDSLQLDKAYATFKEFEAYDDSSDASTMLRRNLSAALQAKTADILEPMLEDVAKFSSSIAEIAQAREDLEKAAELLGPKHFLFEKLQARILFLKAIEMFYLGTDTESYSLCAEQLEKSVALEPNAPYTYFYLSRAYHYAGDLQKAELSIQKYLDLIPTSPWAHYSYGYVLFDLKRFEEASTELGKAIELDPEYAAAYIAQGCMLHYLKRYDEAEQKYLKAIELDPTHYLAYYNYALTLEALGRTNDAELYYQGCLRLKPDFESAHYAYGYSLIKQGRNEEAEKELRKASELSPTNARYLYWLAYSLSKLNRKEEAIATFNRSIEIDSESSDAYISLGIVLYESGRYEESTAAYKKAISLNPEDPLPHFNLGLTLEAMKQYDEAEKEYIKTNELDPSYADAYYSYGLLLDDQKRYDEAIAMYKKYNLYSKSPEFGLQRIADLFFYSMQEYDSSALYYEQLIRILPNDTLAYHGMGYSYLFLNNPLRAEQVFEKMTMRFPAYIWGQYSLARVLCVEGKTKEAIQQLEIALEKGMRDLGYIENDTYMNSIRTLPEFKKTLKKHFDKNELSQFPKLFIVVKAN